MSARVILTPYDHERRAEALLRDSSNAGDGEIPGGDPVDDHYRQAALVHATLAVAGRLATLADAMRERS